MGLNPSGHMRSTTTNVKLAHAHPNPILCTCSYSAKVSKLEEGTTGYVTMNTISSVPVFPRCWAELVKWLLKPNCGQFFVSGMLLGNTGHRKLANSLSLRQ